MIVLAGNRRGMGDEEGIANAVAYFNRIKAMAEDKQITLCLEYLNSKVNHKDYHFDKMWWGVEVCKRVNSPRVKILYDIYHAQIMEGDIIRPSGTIFSGSDTSTRREIPAGTRWTIRRR